MKRAVIVAAVVALSGCANSINNYAPVSAPVGVETERSFAMNFDRLWDRTVSELSQSFFVINNISRDSRIINVSFNSNTPEDFVDCGESTFTATHPARGEETWRYPTAGSIDHWAGLEGTNHIINRSRRSSLEGRMNIFMAPEGGGRTMARVNAAYALGIEVVLTGVTVPLSNRVDTVINLTTASSGSGEGITCYSKGVLEQQVLDLVSAASGN